MAENARQLPCVLDPLIAEAKRRRRRRYLLAGALAAVILALSLVAYARLEREGRQVAVSHQPQASLSMFAGRWGGHHRGLAIQPSGRGQEGVDIVRLHPPFAASLSFRIISVTGTPARAEARFRITEAHHWFRALSDAPVRVGAVGILRLRRGVITDSITGNDFCGPGAAPMACGA